MAGVIALIFVFGLLFSIFTNLGSFILWAALLGWTCWEMSYFGDFVALTEGGSLTSFAIALISASLLTLSFIFPLGIGINSTTSHRRRIATFNFDDFNFFSWGGDGD